MINQVFNKKRSSRLSCDKLMVVAGHTDSVDVVAYNFYKKKWDAGVRVMNRDHFLKNYEPTEMTA